MLLICCEIKSWGDWNGSKAEGSREGGRAPTELTTSSYQEQLITRSYGIILQDTLYKFKHCKTVW